ncbi:MAG TPA: hypothetical protein DHV84_06140 [Desulfotomaculum sp.]|jgi:hypothetical protein|nr:hypothetical protein [Desulfotomaculum sp.]
MENIFYTILALHIAGKPVNKENIKTVLSRAGVFVDEPVLEACTAFVQVLAEAQRKKEKPVDPRLVNFLTSELEYRKKQVEYLEGLLSVSCEYGHEEIPWTPKETVNRQQTTILPQEPSGATEVEQASRVGFQPARSLLGATESAPVVPEPVLNKAASHEVKPDLNASTLIKDNPEKKGRYIYGIAGCGESAVLGAIGIDDEIVYTIPDDNLCAIVHNCSEEPYQSSDNEAVKRWVKEHQKVLDLAQEKFGPVIPFGFDMIIKPENGVENTELTVKNWLKRDREKLIDVLAEIKGKDEYGIQISYEPKVVAETVLKESTEIKKIEEEMAAKPKGLAYIYKQKLEKAIKDELEKYADEWFKDFYERIKPYTQEIINEKNKKPAEGKIMLMNLSCLIDKNKVASLGEELEKIDQQEGFSVHFSGPWPPYSFVAKPIATTSEGGDAYAS